MQMKNFRKADRYATRLGNDSKRRYARAYIAYRLSAAVGKPAERAFCVSPEAANRIQLSVDALVNDGRG